ncbi:MAG: autotransporter-associated beta strand repeat-containing protein [Thermoguttaceae bacterium]|nr:autotransporter-associated beta strand repeat-containing protein [Thermoguttaceae bacterium]
MKRSRKNPRIRTLSAAALLTLPVSAVSTVNAAAITDANFNASANYAESVSFDLTGSQTWSGIISGASSTLTKTGTGTLTISADQTFQGATLISGGALSIGNVSRLASTSGITLSNGGTLKYTAKAGTLAPTITVGAGETGTVEFKSATSETLSMNLAGSGKIVLAGNSNATGTGNVNSFVIRSDSAFTGDVEITGGKIRLLGDLPKVNSIILNGGSVMNDAQMNIGNENTKISTDLVLGEKGGTVRVGFDNSRLIWSGKITGTGTFGIGGDSGTFCFANSANDFSGGLQIGDVMNGNFNQVTKAELRASNSLGTGVVSFGAGANHWLDLYGHSIVSTPIAGLSATRSGVEVKNSKSTVSTLTLSVPDGQTLTYAGKMTGKIDLAKSGAGTQILTGTGSTRTGNTTVNEGTLRLTSGAKLGGGLLTVTGTGTLDLAGLTDAELSDAGKAAGLAGNSANAILTNSNAETPSALTLELAGDQTYAGKLTGKLSLTKTGTGTQTLAGAGLGANVSAKVSEGKLLIQNPGGSAANAFTLDGGTLAFEKNGALTLSTKIDVTANGGTIQWITTGTNALSFGINGTGTTENTVLTFTASNNASGNCSTLTPTALSNFSGKFEITAGKLNITSMNYLPAKGIILSGGTLMLNIGGTQTYAAPISLTDGTFSTIRNGSFGTHVFTGKISGTGELGISGDNGTTVFKNSANDFSGGLVIGTQKNRGNGPFQSKVQAGAENALGTGPVTVIGASEQGASTLDLKGFSQKIGGLISTEKDTFAVVKNSGAEAGLTLNVAEGKDLTYASELSGALNVTKDGKGTQTLTGEKILYSGSTTVNDGTLRIDAVPGSLTETESPIPAHQFFLNGGTLYQVSALNDAAKNANYSFNGGTLSVTGVSTDHLNKISIEADGGTIDWRGKGTDQLYLTLANGTTAAKDTVFMLNGINVTGGNCNSFHIVTNNFTGKIGVSGGKLIAKTDGFSKFSGVVLDGGTLMFNANLNSLKNFTLPIELTENGGTLRGGSNITYTMKGVISGTGELGISGDNGPIVFANSQNSFSGGLNVGANLNIGDENKAIAKLGANDALGTGVVSISHAKASLDLAGFSLTNTPIAGLSSTVSGAVLKNSSANASTLTLQVPEGKSESYAGQVTGNIELVKTGAGNQTFTGAYASTGNITIADGTLTFADNSFDLPNSALSIEETGILALNGASLDLGSLDMALESLLFFDPASETISLTTDSFQGKAGDFSLSWNGVTDTLFGNLADYFTMDPNGFLSLTALPAGPDVPGVPEPATWLLLLAGLGIFKLRCRTSRN